MLVRIPKEPDEVVTLKPGYCFCDPSQSPPAGWGRVQDGWTMGTTKGEQMTDQQLIRWLASMNHSDPEDAQ